MKFTAFQYLKTGFATAIVVLLLSLIMNYKLSLELQDNVAQTEKIYRAVHQMDKVLHMQFLCESNVRGFLVTKDDHFIEEYRKHKSQLLQELKVLNGMPYSKRSFEYNDLLKARVGTMDEKMKRPFPYSENSEALLALITRGRMLSDSILKVKEEIESQEMQLLADRSEKVAEELIDMKYILFFCVLMSFVIGLLALGIMKKYMQQKQKYLDDLKALDENKNKFFSIISHDLRAPVGQLVQLTKMMNDSYERHTKEQFGEMLSLGYSSSVRIKGLLDNLLTWGKIQMERVEFSPEEVHVFQLVEHVNNYLKDVARFKRIELINETSKEASIYADSNMAATILRNIIHNAIKYSHANSQVVISTLVMNGQVEIAVRDFGIGMEKEFVKELMQMQTVYTRTGTAGEEGSGLALMICREFVEKNGGSLSIKSQLGVGTVVSVTFSSYNFSALMRHTYS